MITSTKTETLHDGSKVFFIGETQPALQGENNMDEIKGYWVTNGYMGFVNGEYVLFASERDYLEWME